jgi:teichoic acid transport system ATP-binding protein
VADLSPSLIIDDVSVSYRTFGSKRQVEGSRRPRWMAEHIGAVEMVPAVRKVSFVAHHGESLGLIGHNGSGKSTLMRAMAGLVPLVGGAVYTNGRASLLGVGGALMKDLTGERNITLGCLALGLSPSEVAQRFTSIVEFADIGPSINLPMRALSSGQAARLRFAISTAARPEILLIDEALATGDAKFRRKSRERINEIRDTAGTVVLVSHSMSTIRQTCTRGLWMHRGQLRMDGPIDEVVDAYEESLGSG